MEIKIKKPDIKCPLCLSDNISINYDYYSPRLVVHCCNCNKFNETLIFEFVEEPYCGAVDNILNGAN